MSQGSESWNAGGVGRGAYTLTARTATEVPLTIDLASAQTAVGFRVRNSAGTTLFSVDPDGDVSIAGNIDAVINQTLTGNISLTGTLSVTGSSTFGAVTASSLTVSGASSFVGIATFSNTINANGSLTVAGNVTNISGTAYARNLFIIETTSAPASVSAYGGLYCNDVSGVTELFYIDDAGNTTQFTAAGAEPYRAGGTDVVLADGGTSASLTANNGGIFYSTATAGAILAGTATAGQLLLSGASAAPTWSTTTYPSTNAINTLLYASAANVMSVIAAGASGVLVTSGTSVPSIATDIPTAVTIGTAYIYRVAGTDVSLADGGTNASLTASDGGIFYSTATAGAILAGTATANQVLLSGLSTTPAWSTATYPATTTTSQLLYSSATNTIAGLATANSGLLNTSATGVPSITATPVISTSLTIGLAGTSTGSLLLSGTTSGTVTITTAAAAGTYTLTLPVDDGTASQFLQTDGAGVLTWAAAGGGASTFDATAGATGADYTTVGAAVTAGKSRILVIDNTTEAGNITPAATTGLYIYIEYGITMDMVTYNFANVNATPLVIEGQGELQYAYTIATNLINNTGITILRDITIDNNSTVAGSWAVVSAGTFLQVVENVRFELPNNSSCGLDMNSRGSFVSNCHFVGPGTSCFLAYRQAIGLGENISFSGTFSTTGTNATLYVKNMGIVSNVGIFNDINIQNEGTLSDVRTSAAGLSVFIFNTTINEAHFNNIKVEGASGIDLDAAGQNHVCDVQLASNGPLDVSDASCVRNRISNCFIGAAMTVGGDYNIFDNCRFSNGITVSSGADLNQFSNCNIIGAVSVTGNDTSFTGCRVGADAGGGANTITVNAGANRTRIVGCATDAALVDNGTGTVTAGNTVY